MQPADQNFLKKTWINNFQRSSFANKINPAVYKKYHSLLVDHCLDNAFSLVACHKDIEDEIMGFLCFEDYEHILGIHYIFTKKAYRKYGIGSAMVNEILNLIPDKPLFYSHDTPYSHFLRKFKAKYNPYLMFCRL